MERPYSTIYPDLTHQNYQSLLTKNGLKSLVAYTTSLLLTNNLEFLPQFERNWLGLVTKITKQKTTTATLSSENVGHIFKGKMPVGGAVEEFEINYIKPSILNIDYNNPESVAEALKQHVEFPTHMPTSYSYAGPIYQNMISFTEDEMQNAVSSLENLITIAAKKSQRFTEVIRATQDFVAKQNIVSALVETLLKYKTAEYFDVTKDYIQKKKVDLKENGQVTEKMTFQTFRDTEVVTDKTKFGVCLQPIKANEFASFDEAVKAKKIIQYQMIRQIEKPGVGETVEEEKINSGKFLAKIGKVRNKSHHNTQGYSMSGNLIGGDNKTVDIYYTDETVPALLPFLADTYHPEKLNGVGLGGRVIHFEDFGQTNVLMTKVQDGQLYDNDSPINKAINRGYSDELFDVDYNLYGFGFDSNMVSSYVVRDLFDYDHAGYSGIDTIYHRFQPENVIGPNYFEVVLVNDKKLLLQDMGMIEENA